MKQVNYNMIKSMKLLLAGLLFSVLTFIHPAAHATDWQVDITVQSGSAHNRLVLGTDNTATSTYDNLWDSYALMSGSLRAYFPHPEWVLTHQQYQRDIRAHNQGGTIDWDLQVDSDLSGTTHSISWDIGSLPPDNTAVLIDNANGQQTDMRTTGSYDFTYTAPHNFTLRITETSSCSYQPVRIQRTSPAYFTTLQDAYNNAVSGETIQGHTEVLTGNLNINIDKSITLSGGFNCDYSSTSGITTIQGTLSITAGSALIENIMLQ